MTCPPDALNSGTGLLVVEPGQTWTGSWGIRPLEISG
jgi:aldose 1-epimerase